MNFPPPVVMVSVLSDPCFTWMHRGLPSVRAGHQSDMPWISSHCFFSSGASGFRFRGGLSQFGLHTCLHNKLNKLRLGHVPAFALGCDSEISRELLCDSALGARAAHGHGL